MLLYEKQKEFSYSSETIANLFVKELKMYIDYLRNEIASVSAEITAPQIKKWNAFKNNLFEGIGYYETLFSQNHFIETKINEFQNQLEFYKTELNKVRIPELVLA